MIQSHSRRLSVPKLKSGKLLLATDASPSTKCKQSMAKMSSYCQSQQGSCAHCIDGIGRMFHNNFPSSPINPATEAFSNQLMCKILQQWHPKRIARQRKCHHHGAHSLRDRAQRKSDEYQKGTQRAPSFFDFLLFLSPRIGMPEMSPLGSIGILHRIERECRTDTAGREVISFD